MMYKVGRLVVMETLLVGYQGGSVLKVDLHGAVKKKWVTSGFGLRLMLVMSLSVSGPYKL